MSRFAFMKKAPMAVAITAALLLGGVAQAQTSYGTAASGSTTSQMQKNNMPAGTTKPQNNAVTPGPTPANATVPAASAGMSGSGSMAADGSIAGTTKAKENIVDPAPMAGTKKSKDMRANQPKKYNKKPMAKKGESKSSTNDLGETTGQGTK